MNITGANLTVARNVICGEIHDLRFEAFANDVVAAMEGRPVLSTSRSYDLGRDGQTAGPGTKVVVCSSLNASPEGKAEDDVTRLRQFLTPERLYFCSSQPLTEDKKHKISAALRQLLPTSSIEVLGGYDLAQLALARDDLKLLDRHYGAEIRDILQLVETAPGSDDSLQKAALRLAVATVGHQDSGAIRSAVYEIAIREALAGGARLNQNECALRVSGALRLGRSLPASAIESHMKRLVVAGDVSEGGGRFALTAEGARRLQESQDHAVASVAQGRAVIRQQLEKEIGVLLEEEQYSAMWSALQDKLAVLFYTRGQEVLSTVSGLLSTSTEQTPAPVESVHEIIREVARAVAATCSNANFGADVERAITDILTEGVGPAFEWLVDVCTAFVTVCTLGIEATSGNRIRLAIAKLSLILDTDVVLSLLCFGEPDHASVREVASRWRAMGGKIVVPNPVLREAAHHAWIAQGDFDEVAHWLPGTEEDRSRYIQNAFVRAFAAHLARNPTKLNRSRWPSFIGEFRGRSASDCDSISDYLKSEFGCGLLPVVDDDWSDTEREVFAFCEEEARGRAIGREQKIKFDKARRDAELYVALSRYAAAISQGDANSDCFLVSSGRRLADLEQRFSEDGKSRVLTTPAVLSVLALVPGVTVGISSLRALLFDGTFHRSASGLQMTLRRVLRESEAVDVPWVTMRKLEKAVQREIVRTARDTELDRDKQKQLMREIYADITSGNRTDTVAGVLARAIDTQLTDARAERDLRAANERIRQLEADLARAQKRRG